MKIVSIHQPGFLPWIGFFHKMICSDVFVFLDHVHYSKSGYDNRVYIKCNDEKKWLTVPIYKKGSSQRKLMDLEIDNSSAWRDYLSNLIISVYRKAPYFEECWSQFEKIFSIEWKKLFELNIRLINLLTSILNIPTKMLFSSTMALTTQGSAMNLDIVKNLKGTIYLSGVMGKHYLNQNTFLNNQIKIFYQNVNYIRYPQLGVVFLEGLSIIDFIFNCGIEFVSNYLLNLKSEFLCTIHQEYP